jgi:hypothetical protein
MSIMYLLYRTVYPTINFQKNSELRHSKTRNHPVTVAGRSGLSALISKKFGHAGINIALDR